MSKFAKCLQCGGRMIKGRENYKDTSIGLPNVTLLDIEVRRCERCGEQEYVIPRVLELHRVIAQSVVEKSGRLTGAEIRFLRKYLGWSGADFGRHFGVQPETISRWENEKEKMGSIAERLLRLAVVHWAPVEAYRIEKLDDIKPGNSVPLKLGLKAKKGGWVPTKILNRATEVTSNTRRR